MEFFNSYLTFFVYLVGLSFIAYIRYFNSGYIKKIIFASVNFNAAQVIFKEDISRKNLTNIFLSLNFYLSFAVFLYFISLKQTNDIFSEYRIFLPISAAFVAFASIYVSSGINLFLSRLFFLPRIGNEINLNGKLYYKSLGVVLLFINIAVSYTDISNAALFFGIFVICFFYILRFFRLIIINLSEQINGFYMFLYLCSIEIIPLLYLVKVFYLYNTTTN